MNYETLLYEKKEQIAKITMNRPEKMNAINTTMWNELIAAFDEAENDREVGVVILTGSGRAFSSGWDLSDSHYTNIPSGYEQWGTGNALKTLRELSNQYLNF